MKKLLAWAKEMGIHPSTAYRWARTDAIPGKFVQTSTGAWFVKEDEEPESRPGKTVVYARVSGHDQKESLDLQVARIVQKYQGKIDKVVTEIGSGMNPGRAKINSLLADPQVSTIVVESKDRLARMNVELVESALRAQGRTIAYIDEAEAEDDVVQDIIDFMTSVCARMYGKRGAKARAKRAVQIALED